jgi:hypothetical protein
MPNSEPLPPPSHYLLRLLEDTLCACPWHFRRELAQTRYTQGRYKARPEDSGSLQPYLREVVQGTVKHLETTGLIRRWEQTANNPDAQLHTSWGAEALRCAGPHLAALRGQIDQAWHHWPYSDPIAVLYRADRHAEMDCLGSNDRSENLIAELTLTSHRVSLAARRLAGLAWERFALPEVEDRRTAVEPYFVGARCAAGEDRWTVIVPVHGRYATGQWEELMKHLMAQTAAENRRLDILTPRRLGPQ